MLPHHSSLQSALGVLGQGADLEERLANNKYGGGLIYTTAPIAACARLRSSMGPFRPAPNVAPVYALTCVSIAMAAPDLLSTRARSLYSRLQPHAREESALGSTRPYLEPAPGPTRPRPFPCAGLFVHPPARTARQPASPVRPPRPPNNEISSIFEHIRVCSSIFEYVRAYSSMFEHIRLCSSIIKYIRGIFKEYSKNMSNTPCLR
jgi:hypothetical protein